MLFQSSLSICQLAYPQVQLRKARVLQGFTAPRKNYSVFGLEMRSARRGMSPMLPWVAGLGPYCFARFPQDCVSVSGKMWVHPEAERQGLPSGKLLWTEEGC